MIALLLMLAVQDVPDANDEIVVLARKAQAVRWDWRVNDSGVLTKCRITRSSGDAEVDRIGCAATRVCAAKKPASRKAMTACIIATRRDLLVDLADRRAEQRIKDAEAPHVH